MKTYLHRFGPFRSFAGVFAIAALFAFTASLLSEVVSAYFTGFGTEEGFSAGPFEEADGWTIERGGAVISGDEAFSGDQALRILPGTPPGMLSRRFARFAESEVVYVDYFLKTAARPAAGFESIEPGESFLLTLVEASEETAYFHAYDGPRRPRLSNAPVALDGDSGMTGFVRVTVRLDYGRGIWDAFLDGSPAAVNLEMPAEARSAGFTRFVLRGHPDREVVMDDFFAGVENPIFDSDDGIDPAWKALYGLDLHADVRDDDADGDGLTNMMEFLLGTNPRLADTSRDGIDDGDALSLGIDPLVPGNRFPASLPFLDDFERWPLGNIHARGGWRIGGEGRAEVYPAEAVLGGTRSMRLLAEEGSVTAAVDLEAEGYPVVWTDFFVRPVPHTAEEPPEIGEETATAFYFDRHRRVVAWDGLAGEWKVVSPRRRSSEETAFGEWTRVTVRQDFVTQTWSLWVDSRKAAEGLGFASGRESYRRFSLTQPDGNGNLDRLYIGAREPAGLDRRLRDTPGEGLRERMAEMENRLESGPDARDTSQDGLTDSEAIERGLDPHTPSNVFPVGLPFLEDFEQRPLGDVHARGGWRVEGDGGALVEPDAAFIGDRGLRLSAEDGEVNLAVETEAEDRPVVWTDFFLRPALHVLSEPPIPGEDAAVALYFDGRRNAIVWDGLSESWLTIAPVTVPAFIRGGIADRIDTDPGPGEERPNVTPAHRFAQRGIIDDPTEGEDVRSDWVRVTVRQDFAAQTFSLWLNSVKVAEGLGFASPRPSYGRFRLSGPAGAAHLDEIYIGEEKPFGLDNDGDALSNRDEGILQTDPGIPDTSSDGMWDADKLFWGFEPTSFDAFLRPDGVSDDSASVGSESGRRASGDREWFVGADNEKSLWVTTRLRGARGIVPEATEPEIPRTALITVNPGGYIVGYDGRSRRWRNSRYRIENPDDWADIDIHLDYDTGLWSLCIDGVLHLRDLGFRDPEVRTLTRIALAGQATAGVLGPMTLSSEEPPGLDFSGDGLTNDEKRALGMDIYKVDTSGDGVADWWLLEHGFDPLDPEIGQTRLHGELTVKEEFLLGTDPRLADTDGDGWTDLDEYLAGTEALDSGNHPDAAELPGWELAQVGQHHQHEPFAYRVGDETRLAASGRGLQRTEDAFAFAYRELTGNFDIIAYIHRPENLARASQQERRRSALNGLMARASLDEDAPYSAVFAGRSTYHSRFREAAGRQALDRNQGAIVRTMGRYMRLRRTGHRFRHYFSDDGERWTLVSESAVAMPDTIYVGQFVSSDSDDLRVRGRMRDVEVVQLGDEADWYFEEEGALSAFNSFAWIGEWDGGGSHDAAHIALRAPAIEELEEVGMSVSPSLVVPVAHPAVATGDWRPGEDGSLICLDRRGWLEYDITVDSPDVYLIEILGREGRRFKRTVSTFDLKLYLDEEYLGTHTIDALPDDPGGIYAFTPWLAPGDYKLRVLWDGARGGTRLRIDSVGLNVIDGPDTNGSGVKDWVEDRIARQSGTDNEHPITTYVSPLPIEGIDRFNGMMRVQRQVLGAEPADAPMDPTREFGNHPRGDVGLDIRRDRQALAPESEASSVSAEPHVFPAWGEDFADYVSGWDDPASFRSRQGAGYRFYSDVPLAPLADHAITLSWQNGVAEERLLARWIPYDVTTGGELTLRIGDSLLLTAGSELDADVPVRIAVGGEVFDTVAGAPLVYTFTESGEFEVEGDYRDPDGNWQSGQLTVTINEFEFPRRPLVQTTYGREWRVIEGGGFVPDFEGDPRLHLSAEEVGEAGTVAFHGTDNIRQTIVARNGADGPILDSVEVEGFRLFTVADTNARPVDTLPDGTRVIETSLILSPVLEDVRVRVNIFVGGVMFDDGTIEKVLGPGDFDDLGQVPLRFLMAEEVETSFCHRIYVYQDDVQLNLR